MFLCGDAMRENRNDEEIEEKFRESEKRARFRITPFIRWALWTDLLVSIIYLIYYYQVRPDFPVMTIRDYYIFGKRAGGWMARFLVAAHLEIVISAVALYYMHWTQRTRFLDVYLIIQLYVFIDIAAAYFGLGMIRENMMISGSVLAWKAFLLVSLFVVRLDQKIGGFR